LSVSLNAGEAVLFELPQELLRVLLDESDVPQFLLGLGVVGLGFALVPQLLLGEGGPELVLLPLELPQLFEGEGLLLLLPQDEERPALLDPPEVPPRAANTSVGKVRVTERKTILIIVIIRFTMSFLN
jgi:hypothetical protein